MYNNELVPMTRRMPDLANKVLKRDSEIVKRMVAIPVENKEDLFAFYMKEKDNLSPERYWELLRTVWIIAGGLDKIDQFRKLFSSTKRSRYYFSTPEEQKELREMPDSFTVYRATNNAEDGGISWTTSKEYAEHYKTMFQKELIVERVVEKKNIFAFINRNKEQEILIL